jgi:hypothetical protein
MMRTWRWIADRFAILIEAAHSPEVAFTRNLRGPSFLLPFCVLGLSFVTIAALQMPLGIQWSQHQLQAAGASREQVAAALDLARKSQQWVTFAVPLLLILKWLVFAAVLWLPAQVFLDNLAFSCVLSVVAYSYVPILVRDATILFILRMQGFASVTQPEQLNVALGLNLLLPHLRLPWSVLAGNINIFELWYVILLTVGISKIAATRWQRALAITLPCWVFVLFVQFGMAVLGLSLRNSLGR